MTTEALTGISLEQDWPAAPEGDQYGEKGGPGSSTEDAEQSHEVDQRVGDESIQVRCRPNPQP